MSDIIKQIDDKFKSSNSVPVERVPLTLSEWNEIKKVISFVEAEVDRLHKKAPDIPRENIRQAVIDVGF